MNLIEIEDQLARYGSLEGGTTNNGWYFAKAYVQNKDTVVAMSNGVTCKDHAVDGYMNGHTHVYSDTVGWTQKQINENSWIILTSIAVSNNLEKHIKEVLNPYERKHRLKQTVCTKLDNTIARNAYLVQGSQMWMKNATALSIYLTLVRLCGQTPDMKSFATAFTNRSTRHNNDRSYFSNLANTEQQLYLSYINNIRQFLIKLPDTHKKSTAKVNGAQLAHGGAGIHHMINSISNIQQSCIRGQKTKANLLSYLEYGFFYPKVYDDLIKCNNIDITTFKEVRTYEW